MAKLEDIMNFEIVSIEARDYGQVAFNLVDGTIVTATIISIKTVEDQKNELEFSIIQKQSELATMQNKKNELDLIITPIVEDVIKEL